MRAMSRYSSSSSFFADEPIAMRSPASRTRRSRSGTAEGTNKRQVLTLEPLSTPLFEFFAVVLLFVGGQEDGNELVPALANLAASLFEANLRIASCHASA